MAGKIYYHSDDFGIHEIQSRAILGTYEEGALNSLSIMTNSPHAPGCFELVRDAVAAGKIRYVVHLNFIEGPSLCSREEIPDLVDERGFFKITFMDALRMSFSPRRKYFAKQFQKEITAQIKRAVEIAGDCPYGIDGHMHFHMIPVVWQALSASIKTEGFTPSWIRLSKDPLSPLLTTPSVWKYVPPVNIIKWMLLKMIGPTKGSVRKLGADVPVFFGMFFTLCMEKEVVLPLLPKYAKIALQQGRELELMFHAGYMTERDLVLAPDNDEFYEVISSQHRLREQECLRAVKD